ncbi:MAG: hypothetical protein PHQ04_02865 [Opitutaceae bacterium]|nr:hypothetical protein [Opitutaceae bacterium]
MRTPSAPAMPNRLIALILTLLVFAGSIGLGAVWVRQEISQTANRNKLLERRIADLDRRLDEVNAEIAMADSTESLLRQNDLMRLGLLRPREEQVQRVEVSPEMILMAKRNQEVLSVASGPVVFRLSAAANSR